MTPKLIAQADAILESLYLHNEKYNTVRSSPDWVYLPTIQLHVRNMFENGKLSQFPKHNEWGRLMNRLINDGYAEAVGDSIYKITEIGADFYDFGGYTAKHLEIVKMHDNRITQEMRDKRQLVASVATARATIVAAVATSLLLIIQSIQYFGLIFSIHLWTALAIFSWGAIAGIILYIILLEKVRIRK